MNAVDHAAIRELAVWDSLNILLIKIRDTLESPEDFAIDTWTPDKTSPVFHVTKSASGAIDRIKHFQFITIYCADLLANALPASRLREDIITAIGMCLDAIGQADMPAGMALSHGFDDEAIHICEDAIKKAFEWCGLEFRRIVSTPRTYTYQMPSDWNDDDYIDAVGISRSAFIKLPPVELRQLLDGWITIAASIAESANWPIYTPKKLREIFNIEQDTLKMRLDDQTYPNVKITNKAYKIDPACLQNSD